MRETIQIYKLGSDKQFSVEVLERTPASFGRKETVRTRLGKSIETSLVIKHPRSLCNPEIVNGRMEHDGFSGIDPADFYMDIWLKLKTAGLSVVPYMRRLDPDTVIMSDLTMDGSVVYGKHTAPSMGVNLARNYLETLGTSVAGKYLKEYKNLDCRLLAVNPQEIEELAIAEAEHATQAGFLLPHDDPLVVTVNKDLVPKIIELDIESSNFRRNPTTTKDANNSSVYKFLAFLERTREVLGRLQEIRN